MGTSCIISSFSFSRTTVRHPLILVLIFIMLDKFKNQRMKLSIPFGVLGFWGPVSTIGFNRLLGHSAWARYDTKPWIPSQGCSYSGNVRVQDDKFSHWHGARILKLSHQAAITNKRFPLRVGAGLNDATLMYAAQMALDRPSTAIRLLSTFPTCFLSI